MRDFLLYLHIIGAAGWIGGGLFGFYTATRLARSRIPGAGESMAAIFKKAGWFFGPVAVLLLLSGIGLVLTSDAYGWTDTFVLIGIGAFVLSGIWQGLVAGNAEERLMDSVTSGGTDTVGALRSWQQASAVDMGFILVALWAMVVKLGA